MSLDTKATVEVNRKRYEALKAAGQTGAPKVLPGRTVPDESPVLPSAIIHTETVPGGWYWTTALKRGYALRLVNVSGKSSVSLLAWNAHDTSERLNHADTVKVQWTAAIRKGRMLLSDMGRVLLSVIEDTSFAHDMLVGGSTAASTLAKFGRPEHRNTRDNFILAAAKLGLGARDIPPCVSFFAPVRVDDAGGGFVWDGSKRLRGDFIDLRAEMDLLVAISNCPHPLDPAVDYAADSVEAIVFQAPTPGAADPTRTATEEAVRAFGNTDAEVAVFPKVEAHV